MFFKASSGQDTRTFRTTAGGTGEAGVGLSTCPSTRAAEVTRDELGGRMVVSSTAIGDTARRDCGVLTSRVHQRTLHRLADVPFDGQLEVAWVEAVVLRRGVAHVGRSPRPRLRRSRARHVPSKRRRSATSNRQREGPRRALELSPGMWPESGRTVRQRNEILLGAVTQPPACSMRLARGRCGRH